MVMLSLKTGQGSPGGDRCQVGGTCCWAELLDDIPAMS